MIKVTNISFSEENIMICTFSNGESRFLDLSKVLQDQFGRRLVNNGLTRDAKIGSFGEILWEGKAEMKGLNGSIEACDYDISPEFAYNNSSPTNGQKSLSNISLTNSF